MSEADAPQLGSADRGPEDSMPTLEQLDAERASQRRFERSLFLREIAIVLALVALLASHLLFG